MKNAPEIIEFLRDLGITAVVFNGRISMDRQNVADTFGADEVMIAIRDAFGKGYLIHDGGEGYPYFVSSVY